LFEKKSRSSWNGVVFLEKGHIGVFDGDDSPDNADEQVNQQSVKDKAPTVGVEGYSCADENRHENNEPEPP